MFSWFSAGESGKLILTPDVSGRKYAGFHSGGSLTLVANPGETVGQVMDKFNAFRGPDEQITVLLTPEGLSLPFFTKIVGTVYAVVQR